MIRPLFTALIKEVVAAVYERANRGETRLTKPLLLVIDEAANVAPLPAGFSSNSTWVSTLSAEVAVISVWSNSFGHPHPTMVSRWQISGAEVFQTQHPEDNSLLDGNVVVTTYGAEAFMVRTSGSLKARVYQMD